MIRFAAFLLLFSALSRPAGTEASAQEQIWRAQIRAHFFLPDPLPALGAQTLRQFEPAPGVSAEAVSYSSQFGLRIPGFTRDTLSVFTEEEWRVRRQKLVLEEWEKSARAAE